jgi:hypothetical protein
VREGKVFCEFQQARQAVLAAVRDSHLWRRM